MPISMIPSMPVGVFNNSLFTYSQKFISVATSLGIPTARIIDELCSRYSNNFLYFSGAAFLRGRQPFREFEDAIGQHVRRHAIELGITDIGVCSGSKLGGCSLDVSPLLGKAAQIFIHSWGHAFEEETTTLYRVKGEYIADSKITFLIESLRSTDFRTLNDCRSVIITTAESINYFPESLGHANVLTSTVYQGGCVIDIELSSHHVDVPLSLFVANLIDRTSENVELFRISLLSQSESARRIVDEFVTSNGWSR